MHISWDFSVFTRLYAFEGQAIIRGNNKIVFVIVRANQVHLQIKLMHVNSTLQLPINLQ